MKPQSLRLGMKKKKNKNRVNQYTKQKVFCETEDTYNNIHVEEETVQIVIVIIIGKKKANENNKIFKGKNKPQNVKRSLQ